MTTNLEFLEDQLADAEAKNDEIRGQVEALQKRETEDGEIMRGLLEKVENMKGIAPRRKKYYLDLIEEIEEDGQHLTVAEEDLIEMSKERLLTDHPHYGKTLRCIEGIYERRVQGEDQ